MPLYVCRWGNGDFSVVQASDKDHAMEMLDEVANAEGLPLHVIRDFMVHFRLADNGTIELEGFGDDFEDHLADHIYPTLSEVQIARPWRCWRRRVPNQGCCGGGTESNKSKNPECA